jgi:hypothetical protein
VTMDEDTSAWRDSLFVSRLTERLRCLLCRRMTDCRRQVRQSCLQ